MVTTLPTIHLGSRTQVVQWLHVANLTNNASQWESLVDGLLASTAHRPCVVTSGRRARAFVQRLSRRPLPYADRAGDGVLAEDLDDLVSVRCLADVDGWGVHASALNVRHRLVRSAV